MGETEEQKAAGPGAERPDAVSAVAPDAPAPKQPKARRAKRHHRHWWVGPVRLVSWIVILAVVVVLGLAAVTGRPISAPDFIVRQAEERANRALDGAVRVRFGGIEAIVDRTLLPRVRLTGVEVISPAGGTLALVPDLRATIDLAPLLKGRLQPKSLRMTGARIALRRAADGSIDVIAGVPADAPSVPRSPLTVLDAIDKAFDVPVLAGIERIEASEVDIRLDDRRTGQSWQVEDGKVTLDQTAESVAIALGFDLAGPGGTTARGEMDFITRKHSPEARIEARVRDVAARDLAAQSPALAWLGALDAPISGSFRTGVDEKGDIGRMAATLRIGAGALRPNDGTNPIGFESAHVAMDYDPAAGALSFSDLAFDSPQLRVGADGKAWLRAAAEGGAPELVTQIRVTRLEADPEGVFTDPVSFTEGVADLKVGIEPFSVQLGQLTLVDGARHITAKGRIDAEAGGWSVALDFGMDRIGTDRLLALWPVRAVPKTRDWLAENVATGELSNVRAALRLKAGEAPRFSLGYDYEGAEVRFLRTMPPIRDGSGYSTIEDNVYTLVLDRGHVIAPEGGRVDVSGSVLQVTDILQKPAPARVTLRTESPLRAALSLLDAPPFGFLTKAGRPTDIAEGRARLESVLEFPLKKKLLPGEVVFDVRGKLSNVTSDRLVPGRPFAADSLDVRATPQGIELSGKGTLSGVPFDATWTQKFGKDQGGKSRVAGSVELSPRFLDAFSIALPKGSVKGTGTGLITLDLAPGVPTKFDLTSDLQGLSLTIPGVGWSKGAGTAGRFAVSGALGKPVSVDAISISAAGLDAKGDIRLTPEGRLDAVRLPSVSLGAVFDGAVELRGQGKGRPVEVVLRSGVLDLRQAEFGGGSGGAVPIRVNLDRLRVSDSISLAPFEGNFTTEGGFSGQFQGLVNGSAAVVGTAAPLERGTGFRIRSDNAGGVLAAAGIFGKGRGGTLDMTLRPRETERTYDGAVKIKDFRVTDAPVLAELLGVISVVGLLEQLNGQGILFSDAEGRFVLYPDRVQIDDASAVGASLGVSASGTYASGSRALALSGTISPVYILNGIGQIVTRRREGLFGFNYTMTGTPDDVSVRVNPLSILTPGMFREIFRAPPPKATP